MNAKISLPGFLNAFIIDVLSLTQEFSLLILCFRNFSQQVREADWAVSSSIQLQD